MHNEGKIAIAERFIRTLKNEIDKYMTNISKNVYIDQLDDIKIVNLKLVILVEYQNIKTFLQKTMFQKKLKTLFDGHVISDLNGEEISGTFYEKELQKANQKEFRVEKEIKRKDDKTYVKWKGYTNSFDSWIDKNNT